MTSVDLKGIQHEQSVCVPMRQSKTDTYRKTVFHLGLSLSPVRILKEWKRNVRLRPLSVTIASDVLGYRPSTGKPGKMYNRSVSAFSPVP